MEQGCWDLQYDGDKVFDGGDRREGNGMPSYTLAKAVQADKNLRT